MPPDAPAASSNVGSQQTHSQGLLDTDAVSSRASSPRQVHVYLRDSESPTMKPTIIDAFSPKDEFFQNFGAGDSGMQLGMRMLTTLIVLGSALFVACCVKSVLVVWSILGSTVALLIACILPGSFWLQVIAPTASAGSRIAAIILVGACVLLGVVCTVLAAMRLDVGQCPLPPPGVVTKAPTEILFSPSWL
eukprot:gnl/TRDRNA2_/TRDRNA2_127432_c1_seq1.p1 gnl/TRDRNA2_/TRDRNA2_127432_c1~~gnl/TRDRNA2_/TRDRNA2_127432_c1_seq1.p1  ORF type:complete len:191 (-),score=21.30 gnl/TRDRNA2_/TRDRNA2_127432_c1_seq1:187-759(-)